MCNLAEIALTVLGYVLGNLLQPPGLGGATANIGGSSISSSSAAWQAQIVYCRACRTRVQWSGAAR
jgi:hypothetical protein